MSYFELVLRTVRGTDSVEVLLEYATHPSGYVREAVLRRCIALKPVALLPAVAARLHDWVPQVRLAAREALAVLLPQASAAELGAVLHDILRLHTHGRGDSAEWLTGFETTLSQQISLADLCALARADDRRAARATVSLIERQGLLALAPLIALMQERREDIVLAQRAIELAANLPPDQRPAVYRVGAASHFGSVRTVSLKALLGIETEAHRAAVAALDDTQASVRQAAIAYLLAAGFDVRGHYRSALAQRDHPARHMRVCLTALAGLRDEDDLDLIKSFQHSEYASVRAAALLAWLRLAVQDKDAVALAALDDPAPGVRKLAVHLGHKYGAYIPFAVILRQLDASDDVTVPLLLAESNKWNWLECVARVCLRDGVEQARDRGLDAAVGQWTMSTGWHERPGAEQLRFLTSEPVLAAFTQLLPAPDMQVLLTCLA